MKKNNKQELLKIFSKIKFKEKICIIHSDFLSFRDFRVSIKEFYNLLINSLGKNKIYIFPTFSWNTKKNWYAKKTVSRSGVLSEYVRKKIKNKRSLNPIHSLCVIGKNKKLIPTNFSKSSFGAGSSWEWLCNSRDVINLSLGVGIEGGATILHYPEEKLNLYYRKFTKIKINIFDEKNLKVSNNFYYFARKQNVSNSWKRCERDLIKNKLMRVLKNKHNLPIMLMNASKVTNFLIKRIKGDKNYLIKKN